MSFVRKVGDWNDARKILKASDVALKRAIQKTLLQEALLYKKEIVKGIRKQSPGGKTFQPISDSTKKVRRALGFRGTKALIRTGDLIRSITVVRRRNGVFIGVPRTAQSKSGKPLFELARIHEEGTDPFVIRVTPKMRKFLHATLGARGKKKSRTGGGFAGASSQIIIIQIPARPFLAPVFAKLGKASVAGPRVEKRLAKNLNFKYGK